MPRHETLLSWGDAASRIMAEISAGRVRQLSVDVFDTLLLRTTTPGSVIEATSRFVARRSGRALTDVIAARNEAWGIESGLSVGRGDCPDARSDDLFKRWISILGGDIWLSSEALHFEMQSEKRCLTPNHEMKAVLAFAQRRGIAVTALSDMYLSPEEVGDLLACHGFDGLFDEVVTSAYAGRQKRTGRLFDTYLKKAGEPSGLLHVGDDEIADGLMPSSRGIKAIHVYDRRRMQSRHRIAAAKSNGDIALAAALSAAESYRPTSDAVAVGFSRFGPIYSGFVHAVGAQACSDGVSSVWFLAREGWLLHEIYEMGRKEGLFPTAPSSGYLYASRVATMRAQLVDFGDREVAAIHSDTWSRSYRSTLSPLQLDDEALEQLLAPVGLSADELVSDQGFNSLKAHEEFKAAVLEIGNRERLGLKAYLDRIGFPSHGKVAVVDVGWGGQIQENFIRALRLIGYSTEVVGYYLGTDERAEARRVNAGIEMKGLVIDKIKNDGCGLGAFSHVQGIELVTRSPHGSVKGYGNDGMPILASEATSGRQREAEDDPVISAMQKGVLGFATAYMSIAPLLGVSAAESVRLARDAIDVGSLAPSTKEAELLTDMKNVANLGGDEILQLGGTASLRKPRTALRMLRSTLWQEGTATLLLPIFGPMLLAAARIHKGRLPRRTGAPFPVTEAAETSVASDIVIPDILDLDISSRRSKLADTYDGASGDALITIEPASEKARLLWVRVALGAPVKPCLRGMLREATARGNFWLHHPCARTVRRLWTAAKTLKGWMKAR